MGDLFYRWFARVSTQPTGGFFIIVVFMGATLSYLTDLTDNSTSGPILTICTIFIG